MVELLAYPVKVLSFLSLWTRGNGERSSFHYSKLLLYFLASGFCACAPIGHILHQLNNFGFSLKHLSNDFSVVPSILYATWIHVYFYLKREDVRALLQDMGRGFSCASELQAALRLDAKLNKASRSLFYFWMLPSYVFVLTFTLTSGFTLEECPDHVITRCGFAVNAVFPFDVFYSPLRELVTVVINSTTTALGGGTIFVVLLTTFMSDHIVRRIIHLKAMLRLVRTMPRGWARHEHLKTCIRYHQRIIRFTTGLANFSEDLFLFSVCVSALILSMISCEFILQYEYTPIWHSVLYLLPLLVSSSAGEHLYEHSLDLSLVIFASIPWDGDSRLQKDMLFMHTRTSKPLTLRVGKFAAYSRPFMLSILKVWYSIFTLLLKVL